MKNVYTVTFEHWFGEGGCDPSTHVVAVYGERPGIEQIKILAINEVCEWGHCEPADVEFGDVDELSAEIMEPAPWKCHYLYVSETPVRDVETIKLYDDE